MSDLIEILAQGARLRFASSIRVERQHMRLEISLDLIDRRNPAGYDGPHILHCENATDYILRPTSPNLIEGYESIELDDRSLAEIRNDYGISLNTIYVPGGDGDEFDPPLDLKAVRLGDSLILAETFSLHPAQES